MELMEKGSPRNRPKQRQNAGKGGIIEGRNNNLEKQVTAQTRGP